MRRVLRTPQSVYKFIELLPSSFEGVERRATSEGLVIVKPVQKAGVVDAVREAQHEPAR
jgi:hypothetical protein